MVKSNAEKAFEEILRSSMEKWLWPWALTPDFWIQILLLNLARVLTSLYLFAHGEIELITSEICYEHVMS